MTHTVSKVHLGVILALHVTASCAASVKGHRGSSSTCSDAMRAHLAKFMLPQNNASSSLSYPDVVLTTFQEFNDDKMGHKAYSRMYSKYLRDPMMCKGHELKLLEIGVGCVNEASYGKGSTYTAGRSVNVWRTLMPGGEVTVLDIDPCVYGLVQSGLLESKAVFVGSQTNTTLLDKVIEERGPFDLIIDDGSHVPEHQQATLVHLFHHGLRPGGAYVVEDIETSHEFVRSNIKKSFPYFVFEMSWAISLRNGQYPMARKDLEPHFTNQQALEVVDSVESVDWFADAIVFQKLKA